MEHGLESQVRPSKGRFINIIIITKCFELAKLIKYLSVCVNTLSPTPQRSRLEPKG